MFSFIKLEDTSINTYFRVYSRLVIYIIRVYLIRENYSTTIEDTKRDYYNCTKDIFLSPKIKDILRELLALDLDIIEYIKEGSFYNIITDLFITLLEEKINISFKTNNTLNNIVISYFFSSLLDYNSKEIRDINFISKTSSIFIYNSRITLLIYFYLREDEINRRGLDINTRIENKIEEVLTNKSRNYFEELTQIRAYTSKLNREF